MSTETKTIPQSARGNPQSIVPPWLVCIDVETTGLDPKRHGLLSIGAYHPATRAQFYAECNPGERCEVEAEAMRVNGQDIAEARKRKDSDVDATVLLIRWLASLQAKTGRSHEKWVLVGKNPAFDMDWIFSRATGIVHVLHRRMIDVHVCVMAVAAARGVDVPSARIEPLYDVMGLPIEPKPHNAFRGAKYAWLALEALGKSTGIISAQQPGAEGGK